MPVVIPAWLVAAQRDVVLSMGYLPILEHFRLLAYLARSLIERQERNLRHLDVGTRIATS